MRTTTRLMRGTVWCQDLTGSLRQRRPLRPQKRDLLSMSGKNGILNKKKCPDFLSGRFIDRGSPHLSECTCLLFRGGH